MKLTDQDSILEKLSTFHPDYTFNITSFRNFIKAQPEVDAVPVIRCKDCAKFKGAYGKEYRSGEGYGYCSGEGPVNGTPCDGYCNEAVRKGEKWMI